VSTLTHPTQRHSLQPIVNGAEDEEEEETEPQAPASGEGPAPPAGQEQQEQEKATKQTKKGKKDKKKGKEDKKKGGGGGGGGGGGQQEKKGAGEMDPSFAFEEADDGVSGVVCVCMCVCVCVYVYSCGCGRPYPCALPDDAATHLEIKPHPSTHPPTHPIHHQHPTPPPHFTQYGAKASWDFRSALAKLGLKSSSSSSSSSAKNGGTAAAAADGDGEEESGEDDGLDEDAVKELATEEAHQKVGRMVGWVGSLCGLFREVGSMYFVPVLLVDGQCRWTRRKRSMISLT
jgi:hypothetical protein